MDSGPTLGQSPVAQPSRARLPDAWHGTAGTRPRSPSGPVRGPTAPGSHSLSPLGRTATQGDDGTWGAGWRSPQSIPSSWGKPPGSHTRFPAPQTRSQGNSFPPQPIPTLTSSSLDPVPLRDLPHARPRACAWHERFPFPASPSRPAFLQPLVFHKTNTPGELPSWARQPCC